MAKIKVKLGGIDSVRRKIGANGSTELMRKADSVTELHTLKMANEAANNAPLRDGPLKNSITASPKKEDVGVWSFGSDRPYARRQEYEHATRKGFFRKALWKGRKPFREDIKKIIRSLTGRG